MGKRGPQKQPTALKVVKGEREDRINRNEPKPDPAVVVAPAWLSDAALEVWDRFAPDLERKGVLTAWDVEAFAGFCAAVVRRAVAQQHLDDDGAVIEQPVFDKNGKRTGERLARSPWALEQKDADAQVQRWGARFGLSPTERADISIGGEGTGGGSEDLLTG